ncbi:MAG: transporter substrate-binding domain-containing protein [Burkholderiales bacterium]|nr:transporter substrate-binding domain-containing protein [Burkholderiales bacterium]
MQLWFAAACLMAVPVSAAPAETVVRYTPTLEIYQYRWDLLRLALEHTKATDGPYRLVPSYTAGELTQSRTMVMLEQGDLDVLTFGSNAEREAKLLPVRFDILRGMLGYRVLLIRDGDQARFNGLDEASFRKTMTLGFNSQWADLDILRSNGYQVVTSPGYDSLFAMLAAGRFDAFPRGLNEAETELQQQAKAYPTLREEQTLALYMEYPVYFWVRKGNTALADRIERGLKLALADGSYKRLFQSYHAKEIAQIKREHRRVFRLRNPALPPGTPPTDTSWWWGG